MSGQFRLDAAKRIGNPDDPVTLTTEVGGRRGQVTDVRIQ